MKQRRFDMDIFAHVFLWMAAHWWVFFLIGTGFGVLDMALGGINVQ